jgi:hypothetical protein
VYQSRRSQKYELRNALAAEATSKLEILWLAIGRANDASVLKGTSMGQGKNNVHSDALSVDGSKVGILKQGDEVSLSSLLKGHNSRRLETKIGLVVYDPAIISPSAAKEKGERERPTLRDFTDEALEGQLADEELGALLVATDFTEGDGTRAETMRLLHTTGRRRRLASLLGGELLAGSLATGRLAGSLLEYMSGNASRVESGERWTDLGAGHLSCLSRRVGESWKTREGKRFVIGGSERGVSFYPPDASVT